MEVSAEANTAIIALGPGLLCPDERPLTAEAGVFLIDGDGACISASDSCTCEPKPVMPAAVLTP